MVGVYLVLGIVLIAQGLSMKRLILLRSQLVFVGVLSYMYVHAFQNMHKDVGMAMPKTVKTRCGWHCVS